jgi:hypothetical protein
MEISDDGFGDPVVGFDFDMQSSSAEEESQVDEFS